jgi:hypothetical protein
VRRAFEIAGAKGRTTTHSAVQCKVVVVQSLYQDTWCKVQGGVDERSILRQRGPGLIRDHGPVSTLSADGRSACAECGVGCSVLRGHSL